MIREDNEYKEIAVSGVQALSTIKFAGKFDTEEEKIIKDLLAAPQDAIDIKVSDDINDQELIRLLSACCKAQGRLQNAQRLLMPLIGRLLVIAQSRPEVLKAFDAINITGFCKHIAPRMFNISRTDAFEALRIATVFPDISPNDYTEVGPTNIKVICRVADQLDKGDADRYMEFARGKSRQDLLDKLEDDGIATDGLNVTKLSFNVSQETRKRWRKFIEDSRIREYCGIDTEYAEEAILNRLLDECYALWTTNEELKDIVNGEFNPDA